MKKSSSTSTEKSTASRIQSSVKEIRRKFQQEEILEDTPTESISSSSSTLSSSIHHQGSSSTPASLPGNNVQEARLRILTRGSSSPSTSPQRSSWASTTGGPTSSEAVSLGVLFGAEGASVRGCKGALFGDDYAYHEKSKLLKRDCRVPLGTLVGKFGLETQEMTTNPLETGGSVLERTNDGRNRNLQQESQHGIGHHNYHQDLASPRGLPPLIYNTPE